LSLNLDHNYWNKRYTDNQFGWDVGEISEPLKHYFNQLTNKQIAILIPGAGNAYEAQFLVEQGFENVFVCDFAPEPLNNLQKRCPNFKKENLLLVDFFEINGNSSHAELVSASVLEIMEQTLKQVQGDGKLSFDLIIEQTFFCAIDPALRQKYFEKMYSLLKPKGKLVGLLFDAQFEVSPPFGGTKTEYENYFKNLFKVNVYEKCYNSIKPREGKELFINLEK